MANQIPTAASQMARVFQSVPSADTSKACSEFGEYMNHPPLLGSYSHVTNIEAITAIANPTATDATTLRPVFT